MNEISTAASDDCYMISRLNFDDVSRCALPTGACFVVVTTQHLLQDCPLHDVLRQEAWPEDPPLRDRLYGILAALRRTAAYVRGTGVAI